VRELQDWSEEKLAVSRTISVQSELIILDETIVDPDFKTTKSSNAAPSTVSETMFPVVEPVERLIAVKVNWNEFSRAKSAFPESVLTTNL